MDSPAVMPINLANIADRLRSAKREQADCLLRLQEFSRQLIGNRGTESIGQVSPPVPTPTTFMHTIEELSHSLTSGNSEMREVLGRLEYALNPEKVNVGQSSPGLGRG